MSVRKNHLIRFFTLTILILARFFLTSRLGNAYWAEPTAGPPGGNLAQPLNASNIPQTKFGSLALGDASHPGLLTLTPGNFPLDVCTGEGLLAYRTDKQYYYCSGAGLWKALTGGTIFELNTGDPESIPQSIPPTQTGWGFIKNNSSTRVSALMGQGRSNLPSYGVEGFAGFADPKSRGIYGFDNNFSLAYAAAFKGGVKIEKGATDPVTKLSVGTSIEPVKLCLNGVCSESWSTSGAGDSFWLDNGPQVYLDPAVSPSQFVLGGASETDARFFVRTGQQKSVVIGKAVTANPYTCGDFICQDWEGNPSPPVLPKTVACTQDCPPVVSSISVTQINRTITIRWGVDEHITIGRVEYGTTSAYGSQTANIPVGGPGIITRTITGLNHSTPYHYRIYVRDDYNNESYTGDYTFETNKCGDGVCQILEEENCRFCFSDCKGLQGAAGGCIGNKWCCGENFCSSLECKPCAQDSECGLSGWKCCDGLCRIGNCCPATEASDCLNYPYNKCYVSDTRNQCSQCTDSYVSTQCQDKFGGSYRYCCLGPNSVKFCGQCCGNNNCVVSRPECCVSGQVLQCKPSGTCQGGGCFLAGTKVLMADNTYKSIEEIKVGEEVYGYQDGQLRKVRVEQTFRHPDESRYYLISLANGKRLKVTGIHRIFNGRDYVAVQNLRIGDTVYLRAGDSLAPVRIVDIVRIDQSADVYNLRINQTNNYFAEGVLVHNTKVFPEGNL